MECWSNSSSNSDWFITWVNEKTICRLQQTLLSNSVFFIWENSLMGPLWFTLTSSRIINLCISLQEKLIGWTFSKQELLFKNRNNFVQIISDYRKMIFLLLKLEKWKIFQSSADWPIRQRIGMFIFLSQWHQFIWNINNKIDQAMFQHC